MPDRLPPPGPSFLRLQSLRLAGEPLFAGMSRPSTPTDDWWAAILWVQGPESVAHFVDLAAESGPPPGSPLDRLGPAVAGGLSGLILEDAGRLQLRLGLVVPPSDADRPWRSPVIVRGAFRFEPARVAAMRPNELASEVLTAFRRAAEGLGRRRADAAPASG
ncbi:MAG: hypothetical protein FIA92_13320 [Chloroflexi bacterium]|nr:hypothetical protein [Chloroflexota bacterium]